MLRTRWNMVFFGTKGQVISMSIVRSSRNSNLSKNLCLCRLSASLVKIQLQRLCSQQDQICCFRQARASNSKVNGAIWTCQILCLSRLSVTFIKIQSKLNRQCSRLRSNMAFFCTEGQVIPKSIVRSLVRDFMPVQIICKSRNDPIKTKKAMSNMAFFGSQGQVTPKWIIQSCLNLNLSEILWLSVLPASLTKINQKWSRYSPDNIFPLYVYGEIVHRSRPKNSKANSPIWSEIELARDFIAVLVTCKYDKDPIKNEIAILRTTFPHYKSMGALWLPWKPKFWSYLPQIYMQPFSHPNDATHKFWSRLANLPQRYFSLNGQRDGGPLLYRVSLRLVS